MLQNEAKIRHPLHVSLNMVWLQNYWGERARGVWFSSIMAAYVPGNLKDGLLCKINLPLLITMVMFHCYNSIYDHKLYILHQWNKQDIFWCVMGLALKIYNEWWNITMGCEPCPITKGLLSYRVLLIGYMRVKPPHFAAKNASVLLGTAPKQDLTRICQIFTGILWFHDSDSYFKSPILENSSFVIGTALW